MTTPRVGITAHAYQRLRERVDGLRTASESTIRAAVADMLATAQPFDGPLTGDGTRRMHLCQYWGEPIVLVTLDKPGHAPGVVVRLVLTCMPPKQAKVQGPQARKHWKRVRKRSRPSAEYSAKINGGYRNAGNDWSDDE